MDKQRISEDLFRLLQEGDAAISKESPVHELAQSSRARLPENPPQILWRNIQNNIVQAATPTLIERLRQILSTPRVPVFAFALVAIIGSAFFLINRATVPAQVPLVEITATSPQKKGAVIVARGLRIEAATAGNIRRIGGATEKIVFESGTWSVALAHNELQQRTQFVFPGGALEPLGTAFTIDISHAGTAVKLTEGKIRLMEYESSKKVWRTSEVSAPFQGVIKPEQVFADTPEEAAKVDEKPKPASRYAALAGKQVAIELKNGDRLSGLIKSATPGRLVLQSSAGTMFVRESDILRIEPK